MKRTIRRIIVVASSLAALLGVVAEAEMNEQRAQINDHDRAMLMDASAQQKRKKNKVPCQIAGLTPSQTTISWCWC